MKIKKLLIGLMGSLFLTSAMVGTLSASAASYKRISGVWQYPQETDYWCGYAAFQSAINNEQRIKNMVNSYNYIWSQTDVANYMEDHYNMHPYDNSYYNGKDGSLSWYTGGKDVDSDRKYYPVALALTELTKSFTWAPYGCGTTGESELKASEVKDRIVSTLNGNHAVLALGVSNPNGSSYIPGYPNRWTRHWICLDGYKDYGNSVWIVDPAASSSHCTGFNISRYYSVSIDKFTDFAYRGGIIW